jgi:glyoxylase-like metal-dependent hydrolase (beta-lactamase superfamily II)
MKHLIVILSFLSVSFSLPSNAWDLGPVGEFSFEKITTNIYVMHGPLDEPNKANIGFMNNPAIIIGKTGIIVIDPGSTYQVGKQVLKEIENISKKPILAVLDSHIHGDHWLANQAIKEKYADVKLYAHPKMIQQANGEQAIIWIDSMKRMTEGLSADTKIVPPFIALDNKDTITLDGEEFIIHSVVKAHTNTDIMIEHKKSKTLFLGDNDFSNRLGRFDTSSDISGNIKALALAKSLNLDFYVPGHGPTGSYAKVVQPYYDYLVQLKKAVLAGYEEGLEDFEIKQKIIGQFAKYQKWHGFDTNFGKHINKLYLETEAAEF